MGHVRFSIVNAGTGQPTLVTVFGDQHRFTGSGPSYTNADADGGTLTSDANGYTYTARDGTVFVFLNSLGDPSGPIKARVSTITLPNGEVRTYHYKTLSGVTRVQSVTSNLGYQLKATYVSNVAGADFTTPASVFAINNAVDYCSPTTDTCAFTQGWPSLDFTFSTSGSTTTEDVVDDGSNVIKVAFNPFGPTAVTPPSQTTPPLSIGYYADGRVQTLTRGAGSWGYTYSDAGSQRTTTVTQPLGSSRIYVSDLTLKRVLSVTDELGRTTGAQYDSFGRQTRTTLPEGNYGQLAYDARGNVIETRAVSKSGPGASDIVATASFDATCTNAVKCNQPNSTTDPKGHVTDYTYDATHGGVLTVTAPMPSVGAVRPQVRYGYTQLFAWYKNAAGTVVQAPSAVYKLTSASQCQTLASCTGTADEAKTVLTRGTPGIANNLLITSSSSGSGDGSLTATTAIAYDAVGNVTARDGPLSGPVDQVTYLYNAPDAALRQPSEIIHDPDGTGPLGAITVLYTYNADGGIGKIMRAGRGGGGCAGGGNCTPSMTFTYDSLGRLTEKRQQSGVLSFTTQALVQYTYDTKGRLQCETVRMNSLVFGSVAPSCALGTSGSFGPDRITRFTYDNADQPTKQTVAYLTSDAADLLTLTYTNNGELQTLKDAENNLTTFEYDGFDRPSKMRYPVTTKGANASSTTDYELLSYDLNSNVATRTLRDGGVISFTYDNLDRLTIKGPPNPDPTVTYGYDNLGRLTSAAKTAFGMTIAFTYDALGRKLTEAGPEGAATSEWDIVGRRTKLTYPGGGLFVNYDYDGVGRLWKIRENGATSGVGVLATYGYDGQDRRSSIAFGNGAAQAYTFNAAQLLATLTNDLSGTTNDLSVTFAYNPAAQIVSTVRTGDAYSWTGHGSGTTAYVSNGLNQQTSIGGSAASWDSKGNLSADPTSGKSYGYWPSTNQLWTVSSPWTSLAYDPLDRLTIVDSAADTKFAYDGPDTIAEYDGSNALQRRFVSGPGMDEPIVQYEGSGTNDRRFVGADELGSVVSLSDGSGALLNINRYDEYGKRQATNSGRFQYTGQRWLSEAGLYDYEFRNYAQHLGIFGQTDPIGYEGGLNLYAYVLNDPINLVDPLGQQPCGGRYGPCPGPEPGTIVVTGTRLHNGLGRYNILQGIPPGLAKFLGQFGRCVVQQVGLQTVAGLEISKAGAPIPGSKPHVAPGSSPGTSRLSSELARLFPQRLENTWLGRLTGWRRIWTPRLGQLRRFTPVAGRALGRLIPFVGGAILAYDAGKIIVCTAASKE